MPKEILDVKEFLELYQEPVKTEANKKKEAERKAKAAAAKKPGDNAEPRKVEHPKSAFKRRLVIKHGKRYTKFKLRTARRLYTFKTDNQEIAKKVISALPSNIPQDDLSKKKKTIKKNK